MKSRAMLPLKGGGTIYSLEQMRSQLLPNPGSVLSVLGAERCQIKRRNVRLFLTGAIMQGLFSLPFRDGGDLAHSCNDHCLLRAPTPRVTDLTSEIIGEKVCVASVSRVIIPGYPSSCALANAGKLRRPWQR